MDSLAVPKMEREEIRVKRLRGNNNGTKTAMVVASKCVAHELTRRAIF